MRPRRHGFSPTGRQTENFMPTGVLATGTLRAGEKALDRQAIDWLREDYYGPGRPTAAYGLPVERS